MEKNGISKLSVADRVAASVMQSLRNGEIVPGQRLIETETAQKLGSSRPAVREAFARLAAEGVVSLERNRGVTIRKLSPDEVRDIFQVRANLEGLAARLACGAPDKVKADIERRHQAVMAAAEQGDAASYIELNVAFHEAIVEAAGNAVLVDSLRRLGNTIAGLQFRRALTRSTMLVSAREHGRIVKAIRSGNGPVAEAEGIAHVDASLDLLAQTFLREPVRR
jgi:DNA-binding GntR family transcriptional regulator